MRVRSGLWVVVGISVAAVALLVSSLAQAKAPGPNGVILVLRHDARVGGDTVLYAVNPDGSHFHRVIPGPVVATECPHWSPSGNVIVVCGSNPGEAAVIIDPDSGASRVVPAADPSLNAACTVWAPNGRRLACGQFDVAANPRRDGIYTVDSSDGQGLRRITSNPGGFDDPGDYSPDGRQIVFLRTDPNRPARASQAHFVVSLDGTGLHRISPWSNSDDSNGQSAGSWSPTGDLILYGNRRNLYTVRPDGTGLRQIMANSTRRSFPFAPVWSPNGRRILFGMGDAQGVGVYTARPDGSDIQLVHISSAFEEPGDWGSHPLIH